MDSDRTVREPGGSSEQTVRENGAPGTVRESAAPASSSFGRAKFRDYDILQQLPTSGSESDIYVVGRGMDQFILKLYRYKVEPKVEVIDKVMKLSEAYPHELIRVFEFGFDEATQRWFEIQEYVQSGSLKKIMDNISQVGEEWRNTVCLSLLREVSESLKLLHENGILHLDLKPANVLARSLEPIDFVLIDFGISNTLAPELSKKFTAVRGTPMYQSPESWSGAVGVFSDWWSLGMLALEVAAGRHPFEGLSQQVVASLLMTKAVEIPETIPADKREILHGLLTRDTSKRWGHDQVSRWLTGERNIPVHFEEPAAGNARTLTFMGEVHTSLDTLARAIAMDEESWGKGRELLMRGHIRTWLESNGEFEQAVDVDSLVEDVQDPDEKLFRFVHCYGKPLPFVFMGKAITFGNLLLFLGKNVRCEEQSKTEVSIIKKVCNGKLSPLLDFYLQHNEPDKDLDEIKWALAIIREETPRTVFSYLDAMASIRRALSPGQLAGLRRTGGMNDVAVNILRGVKDKKGNTALIHAVSNDSDPKIISALLKTDTDINAVNESGVTASMIAVRDDRNAETINLLLKAGARVGVEDARAYIDRHAWEETDAYRRLQEIVNFEIKQKRKRLFIGMGIVTLSVTIMIMLISIFDHSGIRPSERWDDLMFQMINTRSKTSGDLAALIEKGANVNAMDDYRRTPLMNAAISRPDLIPLLIEKGANVNAAAGGRHVGKTALMFAVEENRDPEIPRLLIEKGADVNAEDNYGNTPLRLAAIEGYLEIVALLIQHSADVDAESKYGGTPLMGLAYAGIASGGNRANVASLLIDSGADINAKDDRGWTPLIAAIQGTGSFPKGSPETMAFLIEHGADINIKDTSDKTPLIHAAAQESMTSPEMVSLLIQHGADVNTKDSNGWTPLMHAAARKAWENSTSPESVSLLLIKGADVNARDSSSKTALSLAQSEAVKRLLRNAGGVELPKGQYPSSSRHFEYCYSYNSGII